MNQSQVSQSLPGTRIRCREANGQLVLHLPPPSRRVLTHFGAMLILFVFLVGFLLVALHVFEASLPTVTAIGIVEVIVFVIAFAVMAAPYLTTTFVLITKDRVVVKSVLYGKENVKEYALDGQSRARQWYLPQSLTNHTTSGPVGIEIGSEPYDPEVDSDLSNESNPRFGEGLSRGELDWVEWRINRLLGGSVDLADVETATGQPAPVRIEGLPEQPILRTEDTKVRIVEDPFESRIIFPNSIETRSFSGIRSVILGLAVLGVFLFFVVKSWNQFRHSHEFAVAVLIFGALISLVGLAEALKGLTRLFGRRELRITPETVSYRTTLLGVGLPLTLPTADVISVGVPQHRRRGRIHSNRTIAPTKGCVIRTAERELKYSEAVSTLSEEETQWIIEEVARRINAARSVSVS